MPRGRAGMKALKTKLATSAQLASLSQKRGETLSVHASAAIGTLQDSIVSFAGEHREEIRTDPAFRAQLMRMCGPLGVDPIGSVNGFWGRALGIGDFYYEMAVKASEICVAMRGKNGGVMELEELRVMLEKRENKKNGGKNGKNVVRSSSGDVLTAIKKLEVLGTSFRVVDLNGRKMVLSVPMELDGDHMKIMALAEDPDSGEAMGVVTVGMVVDNTKWEEERAQRGIDLLVKEGMVWVDYYNGET